MLMQQLRRHALAAVCGVASFGFMACASDQLDIPANAQEMVSGNDRMTFTSTGPGTVLVEDVSNSSIVYRGRVSTGDTVVLDPRNNKLTLNSTVISDQTLHGGDEFRIFFTAREDEHHPMD
jgi:hypothetical protein